MDTEMMLDTAGSKKWRMQASVEQLEQLERLEQLEWLEQPGQPSRLVSSMDSDSTSETSLHPPQVGDLVIYCAVHLQGRDLQPPLTRKHRQGTDLLVVQL